MTLLRRVLGDTLRGRRLRQRRTLREVSGAARVSLGYLSEVERGQKEASSELLASICDALDVKMSDVLSEVSESMRRSERAAEVARMPGRVMIPAPARRPVPAGVGGGPFDDLPEFDPGAFEEFEDFEDGLQDGLEDGLEDGLGDGEAPVDAAGEDGSGFPGPDAGSAADRAGMTDSLGQPAGEPGALPEPGRELELDDVDLAELETGDGLGELEVLVGLTDLPGGARCLVAA
jgi:XRE family transcriptional regulator, stress-response regulator